MKVPTMAEMMAQGKQPEVLFWVGCAGSFDQRAQKVTIAFVKILNAAGIDFAILGKEESCTGNVSSSNSTQVNVGGKNPRQHQEVRHETRRGRSNPSRVHGPTVSVDAVAPINVQTPDNFPY